MVERAAGGRAATQERGPGQRIRDCMLANSKNRRGATPTEASSLGIAVIPGKCAISSVIGCYYTVITGLDLG